jgi:hypothetical protein
VGRSRGQFFFLHDFEQSAAFSYLRIPIVSRLSFASIHEVGDRRIEGTLDTAE